MEAGRRIKSTVEDIKAKGGVNSPAFWDFKSKMEGKKQEGVSAIKRKDGSIIEDVDEIKKEYENYYIELFVIDGSSNETEEVVVNLARQKVQYGKKGKGNQHKRSHTHTT